MSPRRAPEAVAPSRLDFLSDYRSSWADGPWGVYDAVKRRQVGAVSTGDPCVGLPESRPGAGDGRVVPERAS